MADPIFGQATPTLLSRSGFRLKPRTRWCCHHLAKSELYMVLNQTRKNVLCPIVHTVQAHTHVSSEGRETRAKRARDRPTKDSWIQMPSSCFTFHARHFLVYRTRTLSVKISVFRSSIVASLMNILARPLDRRRGESYENHGSYFQGVA
jgi:hypothetical protein